MTLTDFLLARIAEDEAGAISAADSGHAGRVDDSHWYASPDWTFHRPIHEQGSLTLVSRSTRTLFACSTCDEGQSIGVATPAEVEHIARHDPARVLAECEAKRRIVGEHVGRNFVTVASFRAVDAGAACSTCRSHDGDSVTWPCITVRALATVYADHPDYREEWRP